MIASHNKKTILQKILLLISFIFIVELVLGESGNFIVIAGIAIRKVLFGLCLLSLSLYVLLFARNIQIKRFDFFVLAFIVWNVIWMTLIPFIKGGSISGAIDDADTVFVMALYFPVVFLVRQGVIHWERINTAFIFLAVLLAIWHIIMYALESLFPGMYINYYKYFLPAVTFGLFGGASPVEGLGLVRIITTTSIYMIVAFILLLGKKNKKAKDEVFLIFLLIGIITTFTRSILISALLGIVLFLIPIHKSMIRVDKTRRLVTVLSCVLVVLLANVLFVLPLSKLYVKNVLEKYRTHSEELSEGEKALAEGLVSNGGDVIDRLASSASESDIGNKLRAEQTKALINKWKSSPIVGFGYGSYAEDCIRSEEIPYMYESTASAMLMKLGIVGIAAWGMLIVAMIYYAFKNKYMKKQYSAFRLWLIGCIAFALSVQTNPFLFTFCGLSIILFFCVDLDTKANIEGNHHE